MAFMYYDFTPGPRPNALEHYAWQMKLEPSSFHHITWWTTLASCCCQLQPTKSRKCSSSPCGWWEFFVTNGQKSWIFPFILHASAVLAQKISALEIEKAWFLLGAKVSCLFTQQLMDGQCVQSYRGQFASEKYTICRELRDMQRVFLRA